MSRQTTGSIETTQSGEGTKEETRKLIFLTLY